LLIANIQRSRYSILGVWPEDDPEEKLDNMYRLGGRESLAGPN
jgi:hypothetical protein